MPAAELAPDAKLSRLELSRPYWVWDDGSMDDSMEGVVEGRIGETLESGALVSPALLL